MVGAVQAADKVTGSTVKDRLLRMLDYVLRAKGSATTREVLRVVDPDPYRDAVRDAWAQRTGWQALAGPSAAMAVTAIVASQPAAAVQPPGFLAVLGYDPVLPVAVRRELLETAIGRQPGDLSLLMTMAATFREPRENNPDALVRWFQAAAAAAPDNPTPFLNLGVSLSDRGDIRGAERAYLEALRRDPNDAKAHNNLGLILGRKRELDGAERAFREAVRLDPGNASFHNNLGAVLQLKSDYPAAEREHREAIRIDPSNPKSHYNLGAVQQERGDLNGAERSFREAARLDPQLALAYYTLGLLLGRKGDFSGAEQAFREAIRLDPNNSLAHNNLGVVLERKEERDGAEQAYRVVIRLDPTNARAHHNLGTVLAAKGNWSDAEQSYREAIRLNPRYALAYFNLSILLEQKGDLDGAVEGYASAIRIDPTLQTAIQNLQRAKRRRSLLPRLERVLAGTDRPANAVEAVGFADLCQLRFQRKFAAAARLYEQAFADDPKVADGHFYNAATAAAQAARGDGVDAPADPEGRAKMRAMALCWLQATLMNYQSQAASDDASKRQQIIQALTFWLGDPALSGTRGKADTADWPANEQAEWKAFWHEVQETLAKARISSNSP